MRSFRSIHFEENSLYREKNDSFYSDIHVSCLSNALSYYEKAGPPSYSESDRYHRGRTCVDRHGALPVW